MLAGPLCTMVLGDMGADVIKVERPGHGDETRSWGPPWVEWEGGRESAYFLCINRNKRSITADLGSEQGRDIVLRLAAEADVLVENFAPGTLERWGLGYDALSRSNPRLVWCSITGYGSDGPEAGRPGYDFAVQGRSGWMAVTGDAAGEPTKVGVAVVDLITGQNAAIGVLAALREREVSGMGQRLEVALFDAALAGLINVAQSALVGAPTRRYGNTHPNIVPYQTFQAADRALVIAVGNDVQWQRLCAVLEMEELARDARFATNPDRVENRRVLTERLAVRIRSRDASAWLQRLEAAGVPCAPVQSVQEAIDDPVLRERGGVWTMADSHGGEVETIASPIRFSRTPSRLRRAAPGLGADSAAVAEHGWKS